MKHHHLHWDGKHRFGLFELFRYYRYHEGQSFAPHVDHRVFTEDLDGTESRFTLLFYLNNDAEGGETRFTKIGQQVTPTTGMALAFRHENEHEGVLVKSGLKYVIRTDVMYKWSVFILQG